MEPRTSRGSVTTLYGALVALLVLAPAATGAQALRIEGSCRDGVPHGAWQLAMPDGRPRALGAFARGKRTGSFIFWNGAGVRVAHVPYDDDVKSGTLALWHGDAARGESRQRLEAVYADGALHGVKRSWYRDGRLRAEYRYADGRLVDAKAWDASGRPLADDEARARADADFKADEDYYASLDRLVDGNLPTCDPRTPPKPR